MECPLCFLHPTEVPLLSPTCLPSVCERDGAGEESSRVSPHIHPPANICEGSMPSKLFLADTLGHNLSKGSREPMSEGHTVRHTLFKCQPSGTAFSPAPHFLACTTLCLYLSAFCHTATVASLHWLCPTTRKLSGAETLPLLVTDMFQACRTHPGTR